ncbi:MAG: TonB-dependent receptor [Desulfuromonas sp.]|nr:TonB-dependent receptor [Desulfuromonas sp.]
MASTLPWRGQGVVYLLAMLYVLASITAAQAEEIIELETILVTAATDKDNDAEQLNKEELRHEHVVELAELLSQQSASTTLIRKSGYGNEVAVRGFGKANLRILYDNAMIEGACGSRKDPALSHVPLLAVRKVNVQPGPFDVSRQGGLGGAISVETVDPSGEEQAELWLKTGSFDYRSGAVQFTGGNETFQALLGYAATQMDQYEDGDGRKLTDFAPAGRPYSQQGEDQEAFTKQDVWGKLRWNLNEKHSLTLSHTYGKAEDVLTPRVAVDIEKERTTLTQLHYDAFELCPYSDHLQVRLYHHDVQHNPFDRYRDLVGAGLPSFHRRFEARSTFRGASVSNSIERHWGAVTLGLTHDHQDWRADAYNDDTDVLINDQFIPDVDHDMWAGYVQARVLTGPITWRGGVRYDDSTMETHEPLVFSSAMSDANRQHDSSVSGYLFASWYPTDFSRLFAGIGRSVRLPTGAERYLQGSANFYGNPDLDPTINHECDLGVTLDGRWGQWTLKGFYSQLDDYIYQQATTAKTWVNIDAHIYGFESRWSKEVVTGLTVDAAYAWQRGRKDDQPANNEDKDLSEIPPWKTRLGLEYEKNRWAVRAEWLHSGTCSQVDEDAGEVHLADWDVLNLTASYHFSQHWSLHLGVENLLDESYAVANSYEYDAVSGSAVTPPIVYEPGRMVYCSIISRW